MTWKHNLGAAVAATAMMTGNGSSDADELANLQGSQYLLRQRLDQLALGAPNPVAPGAPVYGGSFPRSFLIPGTNTSLAIGGYVKLDMAYWFSGGTPNGNPAASDFGAGTVQSIPLDLHGTGPLFGAPLFNPHSRGNGVFQMTARESRLRVETHTPTAWGEADTVLEFDFYGCSAGGADCDNLNHSTNPVVPRLRLAYGTLGGLIAGQNFVPVFDAAAHGELLDFGGTTGEIGDFGYARAPQFGYTWKLPWSTTFGAFLVDPDTEVWSPVGAFETDSTLGVPGTVTASPALGTGVLAVNPAKSSYPDGNFVLEWHQPWGHFRLSGIVQDLKLQDGQYISKEYIGYGGGFGMNVKPGWLGWARDNIGAEFFAGSGLGRYATGSGGGSSTFENALATNYAGASAGFYGSGAPGTTTLANAALVRAATVTQWGGQANYQHWWTPTLRTTLSAGVTHQDVPTSLVGGPASATFQYNKELETAHANLIWSPVAFIDTGVEYIYGHRQTIYNVRGDENVIDFAFKARF
jgi:hypothetical protein